MSLCPLAISVYEIGCKALERFALTVLLDSSSAYRLGVLLRAHPRFHEAHAGLAVVLAREVLL